MADISIDMDWLNGEGIRGAELSATFASLRIVVDGQPVTLVVDQRARTVRDAVDVPLYPLAEWLATNWWFLAHEFENAARSEDPGFRRRHSLGAGADGYAYPNLVATPWGSRTRIDWGGAPSPWTKIDFLSKGHALVDREAFREVCADLVDKVIRRLATLGIHGTFPKRSGKQSRALTTRKRASAKPPRDWGGIRTTSTSRSGSRCSCSPTSWGRCAARRCRHWTPRTPSKSLGR